MASIVAKSITNFVRSSPQSNLESADLVMKLSEAVATDLVVSIAQLAGQVENMGKAPTNPGFVRKRAADSYASNSGNVKAVDPFEETDDDQYPETD
jgi:hypothetical protein